MVTVGQLTTPLTLSLNLGLEKRGCRILRVASRMDSSTIFKQLIVQLIVASKIVDFRMNGVSSKIFCTVHVGSCVMSCMYHVCLHVFDVCMYSRCTGSMYCCRLCPPLTTGLFAQNNNSSKCTVDYQQ